MRSFRSFILTLAVAAWTLPAFAQDPKPEELVRLVNPVVPEHAEYAVLESVFK